MIEQVVSSINSVDMSVATGWAKDNQGMIGIVGWGVLLFYALVRMVGSRLKSEFDMGRVGNTLQVALKTNKGWRWGASKGVPSGKSILLQRADGNLLVANFKTGKYYLKTRKNVPDKNGKPKVSYEENELNGLLSRKQIKKLNTVRDEVVASLKKNDELTAKAAKQRKDEEVIAQLNRFGC